jgi:hypothetical protein
MKAVNTINPGILISSVPKSRVKMQEELQTEFWKAATILRILMVAAKSPRKCPGDFSEDIVGRENDFLLFLRQEHTRDLFGPKFQALLGDLES